MIILYRSKYNRHPLYYRVYYIFASFSNINSRPRTLIDDHAFIYMYYTLVIHEAFECALEFSHEITWKFVSQNTKQFTIHVYICLVKVLIDFFYIFH